MTDLGDDVAAWIEQAVGGEITGARRSYGGGTRATWFVDVARDGETLPLVARVETGHSAFAGGPLTLAREAVLYRALARTPVRVPALHAEASDGRALLLDRLPGRADLRRRPAAEVTTILEDYIDQLVELHGLDVARLDLPGFARPSTPEEHALNDLDLWVSIGGEAATSEPELVYAFAWLRAHPPSDVQRTSLVHGDAGPGNFLVDEGRVTGLIDWEFAHIGDPLDDLAWLQFRTSGRFEQVLPDVAPLVERYARASGLRLDQRTLAYYRAFVYVRCAVTTALTIAKGGNVGLAGYQAYHRRFLRSVVEAIADIEGVDGGPQPAMGQPTDRTPLYDRALHQLTDGVLPTITSTPVKIQLNEAAILLRHLRAVDRLGPALRAEDDADRTAVFGPHGPPAFRDRVAEAGALGDRDVLRYLLRRARREEAFWADAFT